MTPGAVDDVSARALQRGDENAEAHDQGSEGALRTVHGFHSTAQPAENNPRWPPLHHKALHIRPMHLMGADGRCFSTWDAEDRTVTALLPALHHPGRSRLRPYRCSSSAPAAARE